MTGGDLLDLLGRLRRNPVSEPYRRRLQELLDLPESALQRRLRQYSTGMKRKLCLIQALQGDPPLLILDEPTEGLDPLVQESFYRLLMELKGRGRTIFMSSHVLSEVVRVCDRISLIRSGKLALLSAVEDLHGLAHRRVRVTFHGDVAARPEGMPGGYEILELEPRSWTLRVQGALGPLMAALAGLPVADVDIAEPRLEEVLIRYFREEIP
jgi:ABC-2 type transport system ATP-binding protein